MAGIFWDGRPDYRGISLLVTAGRGVKMDLFHGLRKIVENALARARRKHASRPGTTVVVCGSDGVAPALPPDWRVVTAATLREAGDLLDHEEVPVVLYDRDAPGADWRSALPVLSHTPGHPCVVLLSSARDDRLWEQVIAAGGYDVARKPVDPESLGRILRSALSHWRSRRALDASGGVRFRK